MPLRWPKPARCPAGWKNRQGSSADARLPGPGRIFRCGQSARGSFQLSLAWAPFPEGMIPRRWPKPARCSAGWKNRHGSSADARLPGSGRTFRCGQLARGSFRPDLAWAPFPEGGGAPGVAKIDLLPGKVGKPAGGCPANSAGDGRLLKSARWLGSERHDRCGMGARVKKEGVVGHFSTAPRPKRRGVLGAPLSMRQWIPGRRRPVQGW